MMSWDLQVVITGHYGGLGWGQREKERERDGDRDGGWKSGQRSAGLDDRDPVRGGEDAAVVAESRFPRQGSITCNCLSAGAKAD